jgi:hypothetical protein
MDVPPPPFDQRARKLAVEFSSLAAREKDPERRQDLRDLAKLHWNDAYGRRPCYWHPTGRRAHRGSELDDVHDLLDVVL